MPLRRTERKRAPFKALLHLDAPKASKARKIAPVSKDSIVLSSGAEIFSLPTLSDVEDLPLFRLNPLKASQLNPLKAPQLNPPKAPQLNPPKAPQTSQAANVNALTSGELVIFVAKTAATLVTRRARVSSSMSSSAKLDWFEDENENEKNLDDNQPKTQAASKQFTKLTALMKRRESTKSKSSLSLESLRSFMNMTVKYEVTLIVSDVLQIIIDDENDVNLQDLRQEQMYKCSEHVDFIDLECVLVFIKVIIVWYLIKKNEWMTLTLHDFWEKVASNVQQKYSTDKKNVDINLKLIFNHDKIDITSSALVAELSATKISLTQTAKLKKKVNEHDRLHADIVEQMKVLQMSWICKENCHNKRKYCWINESDVHHRLTADHIICWSEAISKDDESASFIKSSRMLIEILMTARSQVKHVNSFSTSSSVITSSFTFIQLLQIINESISIADVLMLQMIQRTIVEEERKSEERRIRQKRKNQQKQMNSCNKLKMLKKIETSSMFNWHQHTLSVHSSNSVQSDDLRDYIFWHVFKVSSTWACSFWHIFDELNAQYYDLQTIQSWKERDESHWKSLNISADINIQLTCDVSKYARSRDSDSDDKLSFESTIKDTLTAHSTSFTSAQQARTSTVQTWSHLYNF